MIDKLLWERRDEKIMMKANCAENLEGEISLLLLAFIDVS